MSFAERWTAARERLGMPAMIVIIAAAALSLAGLVVCGSVDLAADKGTSYAASQASRIALAVPACLAAFWVRPKWIRANAYIFLFLSVVALAAVLVVGPVKNGSRRWIVFTPQIRFQPSDFAKLAACLALARFCAHRERIESFFGVATAWILAGVPALLILKEPDLGTALVYAPMVMAMLAAGGARGKHILWIVLLLAAAGACLYTFGLHGYQRDRIESWLRQGSMTAAEKQDRGYHLHRSMVAVGSGGFLGQGFAEGLQNERDLLPERHTDFAFAVVSEEWGFVGAIAVLLLETALPAGLLILALRVRETFARLVLCGVAAQVGAQAMMNMGVATGMIPTTGIALPLVSYGGSSAMVTLVSIAVALNLAAHSEPVLAEDMFSPEEEETLLDRTLRPRPRRARASSHSRTPAR